MGQRDIHLHKTSFFPPPHYTQLITQQCHVSNICRVGSSQTSGKQFSDKWLFLLQVISCLLPLLKKEKRPDSPFFLFERSEYFPHFCDHLRPISARVWSRGVYSTSVHMCLSSSVCISAVQTHYRNQNVSPCSSHREKDLKGSFWFTTTLK